MDKAVNLIKQEVCSAFGERRIISLLFFGTRAFGVNINKFSDYDFVLLLDDWKDKDSIALKAIVGSSLLKKAEINLSLIYKSDIEARGINNFQMRSVKPDFYRYLKTAKVLIGNNYFKENSITISVKDIKEFSDFKIQEYYGRCDKLYTQNISRAELLHKIKKYSREMLRFILIADQKIKIEQIKDLSHQKMYKMAILGRYINNVDAKNLESDDLDRIETTRRNIYLKYLDLFYKNIN